MAQPKFDFWTISVILIILYVFFPPFTGMVNNLTGGLGTSTTTTTVLPELPCPIEDTTVTLTSHDKYAAGTDISNGSHRVFVNGIDKGYTAEDGTFTASPGDKVQVIFGENSTSHYSKIVSKEVACSGTMELVGDLAAYDNSPSFTIWAEDGSVQSSSANAEAMGADTAYNNEMKIKVTSKKAYGNPDHPGKGNIICFLRNTTTMDSVTLDGAKSAYTPNAANTTGGKQQDCWYFPIIVNDPNDANDGEFIGTVVTDTAATQPTTHDNITIHIFDSCVDLDADTLEILYDVQDEDKNALCAKDYGSAIDGKYIYVS